MTTTYLTLKEASKKLGRGFSTKSMRRRIKSGEWKLGKHYIDVSLETSRRAFYKVDVDYVLETLSL